MPVLGEPQSPKLEVVGLRCSLLAGVEYCQVSPLLLAVVEAIDVLIYVEEEPVFLWKEDRSVDLHPFEVADGFFLQWMIHYYLQQRLSIGIGDL